MSRAFKLGLTGGIGSGKSTVAALLGKLGAQVLDADAISRTVTAPGGLAIEPIRLGFGHQFIASDGAMDRDRMRALVYEDHDARRRLEAIIHPLVQHEIWRLANESEAAGVPCLVFDVPLLVESASWRQRVDKVLVIDCSPETQISRVQTRSGLSRPAIEAIIAAQASRSERLAIADQVILNDGITLEALEDRVRALAPCFGL
ncbi:MAG: dephospho-CoA kinase [Rhodoferax sp.]|uniref:dephospho-CoA kinase n=1 Tax=Rhodoferax sp. TaxID=50421 RepID=UPI001B78B443|nr:dephospho-CoA kinase [Rhodoferax sp.]MBP9147752.1 dephospho-CoA kinase [Rhodoferax sp.]MBP9736900.1 dephospho-CoA kinase [Rhodoferax sp.]